MLNPPAQFSQMWVAQWGSSVMIAALWWMFAKMRTPDPWVAACAGFAGGVTAFTWFTWVAWRSIFGSLHGLLTPPLLAALFLWPIGQSLLPAAGLSGNQVFIADAISLAWHCTVLALAALWHWRKIMMPTDSKGIQLEWPGMIVSLRKRFVRPALRIDKFDWVTPGITAIWSITAYSLFKSVFDIQHRPAAVCLMWNTISTWLYLCYLGPIWGQAFRLRAIEKNMPGPRFIHERYKWLQAERKKWWLGRLLGKFN